jgi:hypothetical protein
MSIESKKLTGVELIAAERARQVSVKGWTAQHDDDHDAGQITAAASAYSLLACEQVYIEQYRSFAEQAQYHMDKCWPWDEERWKPSPNPIRNLVKAGALLAAEIDRLQRNDGQGELDRPGLDSSGADNHLGATEGC